MATFESLIREARSDGQSFEDLAQTFTSLLNELEQEERVADKNAKEREEFLDEMAETATEVSFEGAAALATLAVEGRYDWSLFDLKLYYHSTRLSLETTAESLGAFNPSDPWEEADTLVGRVFERLNQEAKKEEGGTDRETAVNRPYGEYHYKGPQSSDVERITRFLRALD